MARTFMLILVCGFVFAPMHLYGEEVAGLLLRYVENNVPISSRETEKEVRDVIVAYSAIADLQQDIGLGLCSDNDSIRERVLLFLVRIYEIKDTLSAYEQIREFILTPAICLELRLLNDRSSTESNHGHLENSNRTQVMYLIAYYKIHPLFDVVFKNTTHDDPWIRQTAYFVMRHIGNFEKEKALACLQCGLEDGETYYLHPHSIPVRRTAAATCAALGGEFHELLLTHAPQFRHLLFADASVESVDKQGYSNRQSFFERPRLSSTVRIFSRRSVSVGGSRGILQIVRERRLY